MHSCLSVRKLIYTQIGNVVLFLGLYDRVYMLDSHHAECCTVTLKNIHARDVFTFCLSSLVVHHITSN